MQHTTIASTRQQRKSITRTYGELEKEIRKLMTQNPKATEEFNKSLYHLIASWGTLMNTLNPHSRDIQEEDRFEVAQ